ncbi:hypothetical protein RND71_030162 [Anisodus tanguticus]|uniref:Alkyl transferase n=1 Tax=Anisodus tanguticus TaxID=243964 RepID=A0AAE1RER8_9SOLA|nr:hypothetical protein RND71_030162 [Anisodus tanguticus]
MEGVNGKKVGHLFENISSFVRQCIFSVLNVGPIPSHIAFVMDGNSRYSKKQNLVDGDGHRAGFSALINMLRYCYELGVKYITVYAFSIDNFKRRPEEVVSLMKLMQEKIDELTKEESIVNRLGIRIYFQGNLKLLSDPVRSAAERAMVKTAGNSKADKDEHLIGVTNVDPDVIIRTSGATRLSNFLLWQSAHCLLYSPAVLWPEIGLRHLIWIVLDFQRNYLYLKEKKKQA